MPATRSQAFAAAVAILLLAGCGHVIDGFDFKEPGCAPLQASDAAKVEVHYLGSGGVAIRWRGDAILLGPSFSNPGLLRAGLLRGRPDVTRISKALALCGTADVRAIFAGHSHYDHIGDLPTVCSTFIRDVPVFVNASGANILAVDLRGRLNVLKKDEVVPVGSSMRVRAIPSGHAPQLCPWNIGICRYGDREVTQPWTTPVAKHRLRSQRGGQPFAFDIELLDANGDTRYRIYYNDSAAETPLGQTIGPFDLAILTAAQWNWVRDYPRDLLLALQPRHVLVSHWDNFFRRNDRSWTFVPYLTDAKAKRFTEIVEQHAGNDGAPTNDVCGVKGAQWTMAVPGSALLFQPQR